MFFLLFQQVFSVPFLGAIPVSYGDSAIGGTGGECSTRLGLLEIFPFSKKISVSGVMVFWVAYGYSL